MKIAVSIASEKEWSLRYLDTKHAFIRGHLHEVVNMRFPGGCGDVSGEVVLMQRAVYRLRQGSSRRNLWHSGGLS